jgi:hypothetical protein
MATRLGTCQVVFVEDGDEVSVDLLLGGAGHVEGAALVPCSPFSLTMRPLGSRAARPLATRRLARWAAAGRSCAVAVRLGDDRALVRLSAGARHVAGELTDLDVMFADAGAREHQD